MATELHRAAHREHGGTFGSGGFAAVAEKIARFFGTPQYLISQTAIVTVWIAFNARQLVHFDPYPFILLNLAFSLQAAYAAPLILLAQTRQSERDKSFSDADAKHREALSATQTQLLVENTRLTQEVRELTQAVHEIVALSRPPS